MRECNIVVVTCVMQDSKEQLLSNSSLTSPPLDSAAQYLAARKSALKLAANTSTTSSSKSQPSRPSTNTSDAQTQAQTDKAAAAEAPDLAKAMADILDFPEDLDGPNDPTLLGLVSHDSSPQLHGMIAPTSRLFRPDGRYPS